MAATAIPVNALVSLDPATGETLGYVDATPASAVSDIVNRARAAQTAWAKLSIATRCAHLRTLRDTILSSRSNLADAVVRESGKPRVEALFADIFVAADSASYFADNAARILRSKRISHH